MELREDLDAGFISLPILPLTGRMSSTPPFQSTDLSSPLLGVECSKPRTLNPEPST